MGQTGQDRGRNLALLCGGRKRVSKIVPRGASEDRARHLGCGVDPGPITISNCSYQGGKHKKS